VVRPTFQRGEEHLARDIRGVGQRLGPESDVRVLSTEAIEKGVERRRLAPERLVLQHDRNGAGPLRFGRALRTRSAHDQQEPRGAHACMMARRYWTCTPCSRSSVLMSFSTTCGCRNDVV